MLSFQKNLSLDFYHPCQGKIFRPFINYSDLGPDGSRYCFSQPAWCKPMPHLCTVVLIKPLQHSDFKWGTWMTSCKESLTLESAWCPLWAAVHPFGMNSALPEEGALTSLLLYAHFFPTYLGLLVLRSLLLGTLNRTPKSHRNGLYLTYSHLPSQALQFWILLIVCLSVYTHTTCLE